MVCHFKHRNCDRHELILSGVYTEFNYLDCVPINFFPLIVLLPRWNDALDLLKIAPKFYIRNRFLLLGSFLLKNFLLFFFPEADRELFSLE